MAFGRVPVAVRNPSAQPASRSDLFSYYATTPEDKAVIFLAGHGTSGGQDIYSFWPHDAALNRPASLIREEDVVDKVSRVSAGTLLLLDTCHSGDILPGTLPTTLIDKLNLARNGVVVLAASTGKETAQEGRELNNGAFTKALVEGLSGRAARWRDDPVTISMLSTYVSQRVKQLTYGGQTPTFAMFRASPDFSVGVAREGLIPVHRRWWFWTALGVATAGIAAGIAVGVTQREVSFPQGTMVLTPALR